MKKRILLFSFWLSIASTASATVFNVTVPEGTQKCYVVGAFNGWNPSNALEMEQAGPNRFTLDAPEVGSVASGFKYICGPAWTYVEKAADGSEIPNRTQATENDVVERWAALYLPDLEAGSVTINATVPENTPDNSVYIYGSFQEWIVSNALKMEKVSDTEYSITITDITQFNYKLLCGRSTQYVEVSASGTDIPDRNAASNEPEVDIVVQAWLNVPKELVGVSYIEDAVDFSPLSDKRGIWVYLPPDYETNPSKQYPVLYMHDGQYVFSDEQGEGTWDVSETLNTLYAEGREVGIVVAVDRTPAYINDYSPFENEVYSQTGNGDLYLQALIDHVIPYINSNYRTLTGPANTAIAGSDMGGLISFYGALKYQDYFGKAGIFSPFFWFNKSELVNYLETWEKAESEKMHFVVGSMEGNTITNDAEMFFNMTAAKGFDEESIKFQVVPGGTHNNASWASQFRSVYAFLFDIPDETDPDPDILYQFMSHSGTGVECTGDEPFTLKEYYPSGLESSEVERMGYMKVVPIEFQSTWYWNVNRGPDCSGENLYETNKSVGFSGSKKYESWLRFIIQEDESVLNASASSAFFRVKKADGTLVLMTRTMEDGSPGEDDTFTVSAEVEFSGGETDFEIRFGSVNSGSVQGSLVGSSDTYPLSVPAGVTRAQIIYNFRTNKVNIIVLEGEEPAQQYQFMSHSGTGVECTGDEPFTLEEYYPSGLESSEVERMGYMKVVPVEFQSTWYWNVNRGPDCSGENLYETNKSVGFSGSKKYESWLRFIIQENESVLNTSASSAFFRVKTADGLLTVMTPMNTESEAGKNGDYILSANVDFPTENKNFEIRFGSVNSGSIMGSVVGPSDTYPLSVPSNWKKATITYNFRTNLVEMEEHTETDILPVLSHLGAVPSVTNAGTPVAITASVINREDYDLYLEMSYNDEAFVDQAYTLNEDEELEYGFTPMAGVYHIRLRAFNTLTSEDLIFKGIVVKVLGEQTPLKTLTGNPYEGINWNAIQRNKANFHVHTDWTSDASMQAHQVVDLYHSKDFKILPITNHNFSSYPWFLFSMFKTSWQDRDPETLGILSFPGNELSANNHHNDFFTGRNDSGADLEQSFALTQSLGGMQILNHPGQYWSILANYGPMQKNSPEWFADIFSRYESVVGLEVYNQGNKHPYDRVLWDEVLTLSMPEKPVWGYSNDDAHHVNQAFFNYQFMLMDRFDIPALKESMLNGRFYFSYEYGGTGNAMAPGIDGITIDPASKTITIDTPDDNVYWISGIDGEGSDRQSAVVGIGKTFVFEGFRGSYVRALITNIYGETCTQPFGFDDADVTGIDPIKMEDRTSIVIFPNPSQGTVYIRSDQALDNILVYNSMGQVVRSFSAKNQTEIELNLGGLKNGMYIVSLRMNHGIQNRTIIINR